VAIVIGAIESVCVFVVWVFVVKMRRKSHADKHDYYPLTDKFRKFSYSKLKKATKGFSEEIGRGA